MRFQCPAFLVPTWLGLLVGAVFAAHAYGDVFTLRGGGEVRGEWLNQDEFPKRSYLVKTESGIQIRIGVSQVVECSRQSDAVREYNRIAPTYADTVAAQEQIAEWCRNHNLTQQRRCHLRRIVELDPKNAVAWQALGYTEMNGRWVTRQGYFEERGYVFYGGKWRLPQEIAVLEDRKRIDEREREWIDQLKQWRNQLESNHNTDVAQKIAGIDDPMAIRAISQHLRRERISRVRLLYITALSHINDPRSYSLVITNALREPDIELFHESVDLILKMKAVGLTKELSKSLRDADNVRVNRAAYLLGRLGDRTAIPALIDALVTTHYVSIPSNGGRTTAAMYQPASSGPMTALQSPQSGSGQGTPASDAAFTAGGGPSSVPVQVANQEVLQALVRLTGGQSFGFDEQCWSTWWSLTTRSESNVPLPR